MSRALARMILRLAGGGPLLIENAASFLAGPWLGRGLIAGAIDHAGPGRAVGSGVALSFDVDFKEDVAAVAPLLDILAELDLKASFALVGQWVERFPAEHRAIVVAGHEVVNHTHSHPDNEELDPDRHFHLLDPAELRRQIEEGHRAILAGLGLEPVGFRAPHFGYQHTEAVYPVLKDMGYAYSTSTMASRSPAYGWPVRAAGGRLWEFPVTVCPRHPFSCFDTWHYVRKEPSRHRPGDLTADLAGVLATAEREGLFLSLYLDPRDVVRGGDCGRALAMLAQSKLTVGPYKHWLDRLAGEAD